MNTQDRDNPNSSHKADDLQNLNLEQIYKLLATEDLTLERLDMIEKRIAERYLAYLYEPNLEDQLVKICTSDEEALNDTLDLIRLSTGIKVKDLYPYPKEGRIA